MTTPSNEQIVRDLIDEGLEIDERIEKLTARKKEIEEKLVFFARLARHEPLVDADREGKRAMLSGHDGVVLPVVFESDMLMKVVRHGSVEHARLQEAGVGSIVELDGFWTPREILENRYKDGKKFRSAARRLLGPERAAKLITASVARDRKGIAKSRVVVSWDAARKSGMTEEGDAE